MSYVVCYTTFKGVDDVKKALVLARDFHQYRFLIRHFQLNPAEYRYIHEWSDMQGWWIDMPVILLEGYEYNKNYTVELMDRIGYRFDNIGFLSEGEMWNEV